MIAPLLVCLLLAAPAPVVDYGFEAAAGAQVLDRGPLRLTGLAKASPFWIGSPWGTALRLADESLVELPQQTRLNPGGGLTIAALVRWDGEPSEHEGKIDDFGAVVGHRHGANGYLLGVHRGGRERKVSLVINGLREPDRRMVTSLVGLAPFEWHYVAATFEPTRLRVWVDGELTEAAIAETTIRPCPDPVVLGAEYPGSTYYRFRGAIDELRIWDVALGSDDIEADRARLMAAKQPAAEFERPAIPAPRTTPWVVAQTGEADFVGHDGATIAAAIRAAGPGDTILIRAGTYRIADTLRLDGVQGLTIEGEPGTVLLLDPLYNTRLAAAPVGSETLQTAAEGLFRAGQRLRIDAPGRPTTWQGVTRTAPYFEVRVAAVEGRMLRLAEPLQYAVPEGAAIAVTENLMELHSGRDLTLRRLILDANRQPGDPTFVGHVARCAFFASGPYNYEKGLTGPPLTGLNFEDCTFRNAHGRPLAWYAVHDSSLVRCRFEQSPDAGVDLDHFCERIVVQDCVIDDCGLGIELNDASRCRIEGNTITGCATGINIWQYCVLPGLNESNELLQNRIQGAQVGIDLRRGSAQNRVEGNRITGAKEPTRDTGSRNTWVDNVIEP